MIGFKAKLNEFADAKALNCSTLVIGFKAKLEKEEAGVMSIVAPL